MQWSTVLHGQYFCSFGVRAVVAARKFHERAYVLVLVSRQTLQRADADKSR